MRQKSALPLVDLLDLFGRQLRMDSTSREYGFCSSGHLAQWLLLNVEEVPGSTPGCAVVFFSSTELFHGMYGVDVSVFFVHILSCVLIYIYLYIETVKP